ncbi:DUF58 domain-containing protein [Corynebacterium sp. TAE3-ERU12]|uniref:DUF58 domain-containing protein n=1 Tax=Corynebacterium sp. TAE3-ERU12 TaxID=2849491 RepID=UPI001C452149|nr:DUF58 domain-containing protein [Corynebacterium sp. TAE3-ERU12]MBV7295442.1 DUF58 domain-containing protein [Corynebacterium sp. TAE3-ERU12]
MARGGKDLERLLRHVELTVTRRLDGMLRGSFPSALPGPGSEPDASREYTPGDDVRRMDWAVTARTGVPHVRDPEAERELEAWIVIDAAQRLNAGTGAITKRHLLVDACAAVALLNSGPGDRTALLADGQLVPPARGRAAMLRIMDTAARHEGGGGLAADLMSLPARAPHAGLIVVISDFLGDFSWSEPLRVLAARTDVMAIHLVDPADVELPGEGPVVLSDADSGQRLSFTVTERLRRDYAAQAAQHREQVHAELRRCRAETIELRTDRDWVTDMARQLSRKAGR